MAGDRVEKYDVIRQSTHNLLPALDESLLQGVSFTDFSGVGGYLFKQLGSFLSSIWAFVLVVLLTLFLLLDQDALGRRLSLALGGDQRVSESIITMINKQLRDFLVVRIATTIALAIVFTAGLILFGVPYAYVWGPLAGVLNLIPYVGAIIGMIPPVIVAAIQTGESATASWYWVLLFFVVVQLLESNVVTPKLVGDKVNLNLLAVLLMTVYWGWLWGALGVLLAVPITGAVKVICSHIEPLRPISTLLGGDPGEVGMAKAR
jgi:predicted PurR-regulated permease PerM